MGLRLAIMCSIALAPCAASAQDVVVMRRALAAPRPRATPTPTPTPTPQTATTTCGTLTVNNYFTGGVTATIAVSGIDTLQKAQASCNSYAATAGKGACLWNMTNKATYYQPGAGIYARQQDNLYAATCQ